MTPSTLYNVHLTPSTLFISTFPSQNENISLKLKQVEKDTELKQVKQQLADVRQQLVIAVQVSTFVNISHSRELSSCEH